MMFQLLKALRGDSGIIECGFVASEVTEAKYFSTPLELGVRRVLFNNYSPKVRALSGNIRRGEYSPIITEPEANNCFSIFTQVFCVIWY